MSTVSVLDIAGKKTGTVELPAEIFDVQVNVPLIHQVVVAQLAAARQGTHSTKTRGEVRGGGAKPYRQKGTGRARQGSIRAPQFTGGGVVHGPSPRDYSQRTPKKMKAAALRGALSDRASHDRVHVVTGFVDGDVPSTKAALSTLQTVTGPSAASTGKRASAGSSAASAGKRASAGSSAASAGKRASAGRKHVLVVTERGDELTAKSLGNVSQVHLIVADQLNTYDVLCADDVVFTKGALDSFLATVLGGEVSGADDAVGRAGIKPDRPKRATASPATKEEAAI